MSKESSLRPLVLKHDLIQISIPIPLQEWPIAERIKDQFLLEPSIDDVTPITLIISLIHFTRVFAQSNSNGNGQSNSELDFYPFLTVLFRFFQENFCKNNIHISIKSLNKEQKLFVLKNYYGLLVTLKKNGFITKKEHSLEKIPTLLSAISAERASALVIFGGQGNVDDYFQELVQVYETYYSITRSFIHAVATTLSALSKSEKAKSLNANPIDLLQWLENPSSRPNTTSLLDTDISLPLIAVTQLLNYNITCKALDFTPKEFRSYFAGTTGHSQGIVSSAVIAASSTEQDFLSNAIKAITLLFWLGLRAKSAFPLTTLGPNILQDSLANNEGVPTPMLTVTGLPLKDVKKHVDASNAHLQESSRISISLINGPRAIICAGPPQSLYGLNVALRKFKANPNEDQSRVPYTQRKLRFNSRFLPVSVPFHGFYLEKVPSQMEKDVIESECSLNDFELAIPVYNTNTGEDLRSCKNLTASLIEQIAVLPVNWELATAHKTTHVFDYGPGGASGVGGLTHRNKEGSGVQVILAASLEGTTELLDKSSLFDTISPVPYSQNWVEEFRPKLVRIAGTDTIHLDTQFSRLLGKPPLMVAGMTPCTVDERFVSAVINAGYHVELAGGGQHTEAYLRDRVKKIMERVAPGEGITLNILYLNPRLWGIQYPATMAMRKEGIPMEGITIAAGVPSADVANEILKNLMESGIKHVSFKPGGVDTIKRVIQIAKNNPDMPVILQWTGGRGGGHHSFEDFHQPMLETYASIRKVKNISLVVGSGFGNGEDTIPYMTGQWSVKFDYSPMPFDGVLLGSRVMVAKEALTSPAVKDLIVATPGIADETQWEKTYKGEIGGIITVNSELGEPIHKIANRGMMLWREIDDTILSLPKDKRLPALLAKKDYFIEKLNADFQKVWFGKKTGGKTCDLIDMTYLEVINRLFETLYISHQKRWLDFTLRDTFGDFLKRVEERFTNKSNTLSLLQDYEILNQEPAAFISKFADSFPEASEQTLTQEDVFHFLTICSYPWRKPVPFIPVFDERFEFWFKKDSLWQADDLEAVPDQDAQRVAILQGPVAVRFSDKANVPVKEILGDIYQENIKAVKSLYYENKVENIPVVEYLGVLPAEKLKSKLNGITLTPLKDGNETSIMFEVSRKASEIPSLSEYLSYIAGPKPSWLRALLCSDAIVQGKLLIPNPIKNVLKPRPNQTVFVKLNKNNDPQVLTVYDQSTEGQIPSRNPALILSVGSENVISLNIFEKRADDFISLEFLFKYERFQGYNPIHEIMEGRNQRIKDFYSKLWYVDKSKSNLTPYDTFTSTFKITSSQVSEFVNVVGNQAHAYLIGQEGKTETPMDFSIVSGWKSLVTAILPKEIDGDLLRLVHLSNEFRTLNNEVFYPGDVVKAEAIVNSITITDSGKIIEVKETLYKESIAISQVISRFLYRGTFTDYETAFTKKSEKPMQVILKSQKDISVLKSKSWIKWKEAAPELLPSSKLVFRLTTLSKFKAANTYSMIQTEGSVFLTTSKETIEVGVVNHCDENAHGNIILEYLKRNGKPIEQEVYFKNGGYSVLPVQTLFPASVTSPPSNKKYSLASGDLNPIHTNPYFADLAGLPGTITHGMWTSASTRKFVEIFAANNEPQRVKSYSVTFVDMVLPNDVLSTKLFHVGMANGRKLIKVETFNQRGSKVLEGTAEVEQQPTSYVFTGQGSQEVGMGMDLYKTSTISKEIWDRADSHMLNEYGVSLLEIVNLNPKTKTVYFGGKRGAAIRKNYMSMVYDIMSDGVLKSMPLFPTITEDSPSYTFSHPTGLLSATQFTQPALTLTEIASFQDMKANGLVQQNCPFAGHSLGEYAALASVGEVLPVESLVDVVFYRGMTMQVAVPRDSEGRSNYGMCAVNPLRVGSTLGEIGLKFIVNSIAKLSNGLLEIVNFNVENFQYVVAGELVNLDTLRIVLNKVKSLNVNLVELSKSKSVAEIEETLDELVTEAIAASKKRLELAGGYLTQERGIATIPLNGIDVPFHSSFLLNGVVPFREILKKKFEARLINVDLLVGNYIPNLTAQPFQLTLNYVKLVFEQTQSKLIKEIIDNWCEEHFLTPSGKQELGYALLIELLAHQFASPVRWIETQDHLFQSFKVERLIEVGPAPILCGMAVRTIKIKYEKKDDAVTQKRVQLCTSKDASEIYYEFEDEKVEEAVPLVQDTAVAAKTPEVAVSAPAKVSAGPIADEPPTAVEVLLALISNKLKKPLSELAPTKTIKDLVNGKSTLQNEILGDLSSEFGNIPVDKAEEIPLAEVAAAIQNNFGGSLGKMSMTLINKLVSGKMPGGFGMGQVKSYLSNAFGLGAKRSDSLLLHGLTMEPAARLSSEVEAKSWLDKVAQDYAVKVGISFAVSTSSAAGTATAAPVMNSEEFNKFKAKIDKLVLSQINEFAKYLNMDLLEGGQTLAAQKVNSNLIQEELDLWVKEHGEIYADGIKPAFNPIKSRVYDSYWNWVRQDALQLYYDLVFGKIPQHLNRDLMNKVTHLTNRSADFESMFQFMEYYLEQWPDKGDEKYERLRSLTKMLTENVKEAIDRDPAYINLMYQPTAPRTTVSDNGSLIYTEVNRKASSMKEYVQELRDGSSLTTLPQSDLAVKFAEIQRLLLKEKLNSKTKTQVSKIFSEIQETLPKAAVKMPFISLKSKSASDPLHYEYDEKLTTKYLDILSHIAINGISFKGRKVLVTGAGKGSIGSQIVQMLLSGGAQVLVTTSRFNRDITKSFKELYENSGSKGSRLIVVPFNGSSATDVKNLVQYIYDKDPKSGLNWDLDFIIPFAAFPQEGRELDSVDSKSELAFRLMLTNVFRLMGEVKLAKQKNGFDTRPAAVLLPLSPNHGTFGGDGLYSESKIALETLMHRFHSENWGSYLSIIGAVIGWTRGTGLMSANNIVAEGIESLGARTFAQLETAFNIIGLLHPKMVELSQAEPVWADLNGGLQFVKELNKIVYDLRKSLLESAEIKYAVTQEIALDKVVLEGPAKQQPSIVTPRANMKYLFPELKEQRLTHLRGLLDLEKVVVVVGFGEVGPWGSSRTRWEMESTGEFSLEGCIEMAWMMGFIKFHNGPLKKLPAYSGWVDTKTQEPVKDSDVKNLYEAKILAHAGIRLIEPELFNGYDPSKKLFLQEVIVVDDMPPIEVSKEEAEAFKLQHGDKVVIEQKESQYFVHIKKNAILHVPKALQFDRLVAGQIPTGWDAARYGVPEDIVKQVDPITLYTLVSTVEALITAGVTDPYEFYQYVHVSEVGNTAGGGMGGMRAMQKMFKERLFEKPIQNDILQESFINTMPAWINMLLLSSSGPIKTPVGACATAAESVEIAVDTILSGKAKVVVCGGYDDFQEEGSYEFANMKATSSSAEEFARGREPSEMCRPATDTRAGFMEAHGAGIHILMTADLAIKMGTPIRGIIACTNTATDKNGRSVPAPGQGILTTAKEVKTGLKSPLLDLKYRAKQLARERKSIKVWIAEEYENLKEEVEELKASGEQVSDDYIKERTAFIEKEGTRKEKSALSHWSHDWWKNDPSIAPIRGALSTFGLTVDDIGVASFHGTGTKANDYNESSAVNQQFAHLGRTAGNIVPCIFQKHLTGHPKGAAAAWMLNGVLQSLETSIIPGNKNCDNVEARLEQFKYLLYPSKSIRTNGVKAGILKSFGFGQAGGEILIIHPDYIIAALEENQFKSYLDRRNERQVKSYRYFHETLTGKSPFVKVKNSAPYTDSQQSKVYLNPSIRASYDKKSDSWNFNAGLVDHAKPQVDVTKALVENLVNFNNSTKTEKGVGLDVQLISEVNVENSVFVERNFTKNEINYCLQQPSPNSSFAGRWAAKEAVLKAVSSLVGKPLWTGGAGAPLIDIEIVRKDGEAPVVKFHNDAKKLVKKFGVKNVKITISHSGSYSVAMALAE
ncbi:3-oxoacyl-[acyl-carrier-protein] synthase [Lobulomyces angularis]|nr:3-oxoacyl-[acyl-carrier-protein] synthase [Lobulomyces angularis]